MFRQARMADTCTLGVDTGFATLGYAKVAALGVLQGITELLPISSTAHMRLVPAFLGWQDPGSAFSAAMQLAALAAVISYFLSDVRALAVNSVTAIGRGQFQDLHLRFCMWIRFATIPLGLDLDGRACSGLQERRSRTLFLSSWIACYCLGRPEGSMGALQDSSRHPRMVCSDRRRGRCLRFSVPCDMDADADAGAIFQLAIRDLPLGPWRDNPCGNNDRVALVMPAIAVCRSGAGSLPLCPML